MVVKEYSVVVIDIDNYSSRQKRVLRCYDKALAMAKVASLITYYTGTEGFELEKNTRPSDGAVLVSIGARINIKVEEVEVDLTGFPGLDLSECVRAEDKVEET